MELSRKRLPKCAFSVTYANNPLKPSDIKASEDDTVILRVGQLYKMGTYLDSNNDTQTAEWICAEKISEHYYVLQSTGLSCGVHPVWASHASKGDYLYKDISTKTISRLQIPYDQNNNLINFLNTYGHTEAPGGFNALGIWRQELKNGLYFAPKEKYGTSTYLTEFYYEGIKKASYKSNIYDTAQVGRRCWLGDWYGNSNYYAFYLLKSANQHKVDYCDDGETGIFAPCFNIDATKITVQDDGTIVPN